MNKKDSDNFDLDSELADIPIPFASAEEALAAHGEPQIIETAPAPAESEEDEFDRLLQNFINSELRDVDTEIEETKENISLNKPEPEKLQNENEFAANLYEEEKALYGAYRNFCSALQALAADHNLPPVEFHLEPDNLYIRYKPFVGEIIKTDTLAGWDAMIAAAPQKIARLPANPSDENLLDFAEKETDENLQLAIISYVEILIETEGCEIAYEERRLKAKRKRIERQVYEEHAARQERMKRYIAAIKAKNFPVDADRLITNYFKTARQDPDGAYKTLINNPATYAPIDISRIPPRFFGFIKATPQDGIKVNKELGKFLSRLKA